MGKRVDELIGRAIIIEREECRTTELEVDGMRAIKNRHENSRRNKKDPKRSWTRLGAILGRSWARGGRRVDQLTSRWDRVIGLENVTRSDRKQAQESQRRPKTDPREPKMTQNEARGAPKRLQETPTSIKKESPNRKTKKGPNQDDPKTVLAPPRAD